jgi:hypothetical protein
MGRRNTSINTCVSTMDWIAWWECAVGLVPSTVSVVNPARRKLDSSIRTLTAQIGRCGVQFAALSLEGVQETAPVVRYQTQKSELHEQIGALRKDQDQLKIERKTTPKHVEIKDLPEAGTFPAPIAGT